MRALAAALVAAALWTQPAAAQPSPTPTPAGGLDVAAGDLLLALGIAALIGAAGGYVYGGLTGRRRKR